MGTCHWPVFDPASSNMSAEAFSARDALVLLSRSRKHDPSIMNGLKSGQALCSLLLKGRSAKTRFATATSFTVEEVDAVRSYDFVATIQNAKEFLEDLEVISTGMNALVAKEKIPNLSHLSAWFLRFGQALSAKEALFK